MSRAYPPAYCAESLELPDAAPPSMDDDIAARALTRAGQGADHVHPDRSDAQSGDAEVPARAARCSPHGTLDIRDQDAAAQSPLAERLFEHRRRFRRLLRLRFHRRHQVAAANGSSSSPRSSAPSWSTSCPARRSCAADAATADGATDEFFDAKDAETVATIKELIETRVRPAVANDGGDITFRGFKDGVVYLDMKGACAGCPSSTATLRHGIQNLLRHYVPDVVEVRPMR